MTNEQLVELLQMGVDVKKNMESLYQQNKAIITKICKPYAQTEPLEDLLQQSYFGLVEAVRRYDASAGYKFMSYSQYWIEQSIRKYLISSGRLIKIPSYMNNLIFRYRRFLSVYGADHAGLLPPDEEIRQELGIDRKILKGYAEIESMRYVGGLSFFKQYGSIVEYEVLRKEEVLHNARTRYENMKKQEQERFEKRLAELRAI